MHREQYILKLLLFFRLWTASRSRRKRELGTIKPATRGSILPCISNNRLFCKGQTFQSQWRIVAVSLDLFSWIKSRWHLNSMKELPCIATQCDLMRVFGPRNIYVIPYYTLRNIALTRVISNGLHPLSIQRDIDLRL